MGIIIALLYTILLIGGFGINDVAKICYFSLLALGTYESVKRRDYYVLTENIVLFVVAAIAPSSIFLLGIISITAFVNKTHQHSLFAVLVLWLIQIAGLKVCPIPIILILMMISLVVYDKLNTHLPKILLCICSVILVGEITTYLNKKNYCIENLSIAMEQYKPGVIFSSITGCPIVDSSLCLNKNVIRTYAVGSKIPYEENGVCIMEHSPSKTNAVVIGGKWQQPVSWNDNVFCGDQYIVEAISNDGGLWSNIGTNLKDTCKVQLAFRNIRHGFQPLIVRDGETLYLHDSDYTSGRLSNYQKSLIQELFSPIGFGRPLWMRIINGLLLLIIITCSLSLSKKSTKLSSLALWVVLLLILFGPSFIMKKGDIRLVGKIRDSHENNRFDGTIKTLVDNGFYYKIGDINCKVVVVQEKRTTSYKGESFVVLEPGAKIDIEGNIYVAENIPMTSMIIDSIEVKDPRLIRVNNKVVGPLCKVNITGKNITIIATGSPSLLEWKKILK